MSPQVKYLAIFLIFAHTAVAQDVSSGGSPKEYTLKPIVVESEVVPDRFFQPVQSMTVLTQQELDQRSKSSLGDTLSSEPGVTSSSFGPGAGRPVIRGLGGDRIRILENGVSTLDASNISPDHAVTIESTLVDRIEVVRGPASLLYGAGALGGVVNVFDRRIAEKLPDRSVSGTAEVRGESVDMSRGVVGGFDATASDWVFHADGFVRRAGDTHIPGFARSKELRESDPPDYPEPRGRLPDSFYDSSNLTLGSSYVAEKGFIGAAISQYDTLYGVPTGESVSIDARRKRLDVRGGVRGTGEWISAATARLGVVDYNHTEYEGAEAGTEYELKGFDTRIDFEQAKFGSLHGTWGFEAQGSHVEATGEEAFQPPTDTNTYSMFALEELELSDSLTWQVGLRLDWNSVATQGFSPGAQDDDTRREIPFSQSMGFRWDVDPTYEVAFSLAHAQRAPNGQELFADGPHAATGVYEQGDPTLGLERSWGGDLTLKKNEGRLRGFVGAFYTRYWDYVSLNPTGQTEDDLPVYDFQAVDADFWGFESQLSLFVVDKVGKEVSFDIQPDYVWARDRDNHEYLPRISPLRITVGANVAHRDIAKARIELQQVFSQDRTAAFESSTDGYSMLNVYVSKDLPSLSKNLEIFARGSNLLGEKARNHVSFIKDVAPLPGASAMLGLRVKF